MTNLMPEEGTRLVLAAVYAAQDAGHNGTGVVAEQQIRTENELRTYIAKLYADRLFVDKIAGWMARGGSAAPGLPPALRKILRTIPEDR